MIGGRLDYLVGDLLAEVTMAILAGKKARDKMKGYATDFVWMMKDNMKEIKRQGVRVVVNAGGINPEACRDAVLADAKNQGCPSPTTDPAPSSSLLFAPLPHLDTQRLRRRATVMPRGLRQVSISRSAW